MTAVHAITAPTSAGPARVGIDRRSVLFGGAALAALALAGRAVPLASALTSNGASPTGALTGATFAPHVGTLFGAQLAGFGTLSLRLIESMTVDPRPIEPRLLGGSAFTLIFEGPPNPVLPAATYRLGHDVLQLPAWHLSPVGRNDVVQDYQVIVDTRSFESGARPQKAG